MENRNRRPRRLGWIVVAPVALAAAVVQGGCKATIDTGESSGSSATTTTTTTTTTSTSYRYFLYGTLRSVNQVVGYELDASTGAISALSGSPFTAQATPDGLCVDSSGKRLFVTNYSANSISVFQIGASGAISEISGSPFAAGTVSPYRCAVTPDGKFLYVTHYTNASVNTVTGWSVGTSGALTALGGSPFAAANYSNEIGINPDGKFLYAANFSGTVYGWTIDSSTGALSAVAGSPYTLNGSGGGAKGFVFNPAGGYLYVPQSSFGMTTQFALNATTGVLSAPTIISTTTEYFEHYKNGCIDPAGKFMYVTDTDQRLARYTIGADKTLSSAGITHNHLTYTGVAPSYCVVSPTGNYVYVNATSTSEIRAYSMSTSDGALTQLGASPYSAGGVAETLGIAKIAQ